MPPRHVLASHTLAALQEGHKRMEESHFELHALLVKEQQKNEVRGLQLEPQPNPAPALPNPRVEQPSPIPNANPSPNHTPHQALDLELAKERQRNSITAEHYRAQEQDAAKLTAENRLLLERVH